MVLVIAFAVGIVCGLVGSMPPAGPISILVLQRGLLRRFREGLGVALGGALAETLYAASALFGMAALLERFPAIQWGSRLVGIAILLGLGIHFLRFRAPPPADDGEDTRREVRGLFRSFLLGFGIAISNVMLIVTWSTFVALAYSLGGPHLTAIGKVTFAAGACAGISIWFILLLWALRRFGRNLTILFAVRLIRAAGVLVLALAAFATVSFLWKARVG